MSIVSNPRFSYTLLKRRFLSRFLNFEINGNAVIPMTTNSKAQVTILAAKVGLLSLTEAA